MTTFNVKGVNAVTNDLQFICGCYRLTSSVARRAVIIKGTWVLSNIREPKNIEIEFLVDEQANEESWLNVYNPFFEEIKGDGFAGPMKLGFESLKGLADNSLEEGSHAVSQMNQFLGRKAPSVISFLKGEENYQADDMEYESAWGSW